MHSIDNLINKVIAEDEQNTYIILDVDRTIINGTSWYKACVTPNLLIKNCNIEKFQKMNDDCYKTYKITSEDFRERTLNLLDMSDSHKFNDMVVKFTLGHDYKNNIEEKTGFKRLYLAGQFILDSFIVYEDFIKYVEYCEKVLGDKLKLIFLSSGYSPFITGLVDRLMNKYFNNSINYFVIASTLEIISEKTFESQHIDQKQKEKIVCYLLKNNLDIKLLADDSSENMNLYSCLDSTNGISVQIDYKENQAESKVWKHLFKNITYESVYSDLKYNNQKLKVVNPKFDNKIIKNLEKRNDKIGITSICEEDYKEVLYSFSHMFNYQEFECLKDICNQLFYFKEKEVLLRGESYYYWVPPYVFLNTETIFEKVKLLFVNSLKALEILSSNGMMLKSGSDVEQIVVYSILEHLQNAFFTILNTLEKADLNINSTKKMNIIMEKLKYNVQTLTDYIFIFIEMNYLPSDFCDFIKSIETTEILEQFKMNINYHQGMRELDNIVSIYKFIKLLTASEKFENVQYVISFAYGGIALGYSIISYLKVNKYKSIPTLISSHFSSKKKLRENYEVPISSTREWFYDYIPSNFSGEINRLKKEPGTILLVDNNSTTLRTLSLCKNFFKKHKFNTQCAVVAFNYKNTASYVLGSNTCEKMDYNWINILDYEIIEEYITAFNTWNSSEKSKIIEKVYFKNQQYNMSYNMKEKTGKMFKLCRVHNYIDLQTAISSGVNTIGIHAVNINKDLYYITEENYQPKLKKIYNRKYPVSDYEVEGIKKMVESNLRQINVVLVVEVMIDIEIIINCIKLYGLKDVIKYIQFQCRVTENYIKIIRNKLRLQFIFAIGINQEDFIDYFECLNSKISHTNDLVLLDMSKHQPDFLNRKSVELCEKNNLDQLHVNMQRIKLLQNIPILLAHDCDVKTLQLYYNLLKSHGIDLYGIDMQNSVELDIVSQRYQLLQADDKKVEIKIRKSAEKLEKWLQFDF